jgi:adenylyl-sulfate kinase
MDPVQRLLAKAQALPPVEIPSVEIPTVEVIAQIVGLEEENKKKGFVVWLTGLSASGKSTIAEALAADLEVRGHIVEVLDGDVVRTRLSKGLGFSKEDRDENVRRVGWVASRVARAGGAVIASLISPYPETRQEAREMTEGVGACFFEVHVATPLEVCIERDPKGLYAKALSGEIKGFTGIDDPYIEPINPDLVIKTQEEDVHSSVKHILDMLAASDCLRTF